MPLIALWKSNPIAVGEFTIEQAVTTAGDGSLRDGSICSQELCEYFTQIPSAKLKDYAEQCLVSKFDKSGMVLQDIVNELGPVDKADSRIALGVIQLSFLRGGAIESGRFEQCGMGDHRSSFAA